MLHIKLGERRSNGPDDPMGRDWVGYDATVPVDELFDVNRGTWVLGPRADRERHALFSHGGTVRFVAEIDRLERFPSGRRAIVGRALGADDPLVQNWVGATAPDGFRNPVSYVKQSGTPSTCACGCGEPVPANRSFVPGHDQRAIHERITAHWGGTIGFIDWFDATFPDWRDEDDDA